MKQMYCYTVLKHIDVIITLIIFRSELTTQASSTNDSTTDLPNNSTLQMCRLKCRQFPKCIKDELLYDGNKNLINAGYYGRWKTFGNATYAILNPSMDLQSAYGYCCQFNMSLLTISGEEEFKFIQTFIAEEKVWAGHKKHFWLSAISSGCLNESAWCPSGTSLQPYVKNIVTWNGAGCIFFVLEAKSAILKEPRKFLSIRSAACDATAIVLCKGPITTTLAPPRECRPECPTSCNRDITRFNGNIVKEPESYGRWRRACSTLYLVTHFQQPWSESLKTCCSLGMNAVYIDSFNKRQCISSVVLGSLHFSRYTRLWTSGTNLECHNTFQWCGTNITFNKMPTWNKGVFDDYLGGENCVSIFIENDKFCDFFDELCSVKGFVFCEGSISLYPNATCLDATCKK